jgi:hypothetical protein
MPVLPYVATVHRPGLPDVHLGFAFGHQAEHASWSLREDLTSTQHVPGTTVTWGRTPDGVNPQEPVRPGRPWWPTCWPRRTMICRWATTSRTCSRV